VIRVLLVDDHRIVRKGLRVLLEASGEVSVVGECANGGDALQKVHELLPDVVLMDISMPGMDGATATRQITARHPDVKVLVLTMHNEPQRIKEMMDVGAAGYVVKSAAPEELLTALRTVAGGQYYLQPEVATTVVREIIEAPREAGPILSARELDVVRLVARGLSTAEIARALFISERTVQTHRYNAMKKLGLHNSRELTLYAVRTGIVTLPE